MKNRIRKSVEMIRQVDASLKDNLSEFDFKLYSMSPTGFFGVLEDVTGEIEFNGAVQSAENCDDFVENDTDVSQYQRDSEIDPGCLDCEDESRRVLVFKSTEELQAYMDTPMIVDDEEESDEIIRASTSTGTNAEEYGNETITRQDYPEESYESVNLPSSLNAKFRANVRGKGNNKSQKQSQREVAQKSASNLAPKSSKTNAVGAVKVKYSAYSVYEPIKNLKFHLQTGFKIPEIQKERLVQMIQNKFLKAFGRFAGVNGVHIKAQLWETIANELNTLGPPRTGEQWKTVIFVFQFFLLSTNYSFLPLKDF